MHTQVYTHVYTHVHRPPAHPKKDALSTHPTRTHHTAPHRTASHRTTPPLTGMHHTAHRKWHRAHATLARPAASMQRMRAHLDVSIRLLVLKVQLSEGSCRCEEPGTAIAAYESLKPTTKKNGIYNCVCARPPARALVRVRVRVCAYVHARAHARVRVQLVECSMATNMANNLYVMTASVPTTERGWVSKGTEPLRYHGP